MLFLKHAKKFATISYDTCALQNALRRKFFGAGKWDTLRKRLWRADPERLGLQPEGQGARRTLTRWFVWPDPAQIKG